MPPIETSAPTCINEFSDIPVSIEARLEDRLIDLRRLLQINAGAIIPLHRAAGETVDVYVANVRLATAEVVVIDDRLALRITDFNGLGV